MNAIRGASLLAALWSTGVAPDDAPAERLNFVA